MNPHVYLIGSGPGDPELLTLKALRLLQEADVVLHDALVSPAILALAPQAKLWDVGKRADGRSMKQTEINQRLLLAAQQFTKVVRLKGGDPLLFARAQEELDALSQARIPCTIVPGITAAQAAYAALQKPMSLRGAQRSVVLTTPCVGNEEEYNLDWARPLIAARNGAVYMAAKQAHRIESTLLALGLASDTPVAWVIAASTPAQTIVRSTLGQLAQQCPRTDLPVLLLLGQQLCEQGKVQEFCDLRPKKVQYESETN
ncbi:MAG: uroporphyrinogen-III C-methyltransferase [Pseudomonadota bacterium]|jgi:uroporphyrin-III C-methyltransferase